MGRRWTNPRTEVFFPCQQAEESWTAKRCFRGCSRGGPCLRWQPQRDLLGAPPGAWVSDRVVSGWRRLAGPRVLGALASVRGRACGGFADG